MARFILRYRGAGSRPAAVVDNIRRLDGANIVDDSGRMLLVDAPEQSLRGVLGEDKDWVVSPERSFPIPDTRKKVERPPSGDDTHDA